jgi:uncharacterized protein involved in cysteine biosynthesis
MAVERATSAGVTVVFCMVPVVNVLINLASGGLASSHCT